MRAHLGRLCTERLYNGNKMWHGHYMNVRKTIREVVHIITHLQSWLPRADVVAIETRLHQHMLFSHCVPVALGRKCS